MTSTKTHSWWVWHPLWHTHGEYDIHYDTVVVCMALTKTHWWWAWHPVRHTDGEYDIHYDTLVVCMALTKTHFRHIHLGPLVVSVEWLVDLPNAVGEQKAIVWQNASGEYRGCQRSFLYFCLQHRNEVQYLVHNHIPLISCSIQTPEYVFNLILKTF